MNKQIIYQIEGTNYLMFSVPITKQQKMNRVYLKIEETKSILRGSDKISPGSFWDTAIIVLSILVPESEVKAFSEFLIKL